MGEPVAVDGPTKSTRVLRSVPPPEPPAEADFAKLAEDLAAALRAVRGYVPDRIWWEAGPAKTLLAYQATKSGWPR